MRSSHRRGAAPGRNWPTSGVLRRPHVVFPDEIPPEVLQSVHENFPGSGDATITLNTENWQLITDAMANVTSSPIGTAYAAHLEGVDFAAKTGTAQVIGHDALAKTNKGHNTEPNAWFVGMVPRRNPDIVVAVLWEHGNWGNNSAKLASQIIDAYVNKWFLNTAGVPIDHDVTLDPDLDRR